MTVSLRDRVIQLNQLDWRNFANQPNPVASALISKMRMDKQERPQVKLVSLQLLVSLELNPAQIELISKFIDVYLTLNVQEEATFQAQLATIEPTQEEEVMEIVTSWELKLSTPQLEDLGEALLDFTAMTDLENWLSEHGNIEV